MRSVDEASARWHLLESQRSLADLRNYLHRKSLESNAFPSTASLRSAFWKAFLVTKNVDVDDWPAQLGERRLQYASYRDHYLQGPREDETDSFSDPLSEVGNPTLTEAKRDDAAKQEIFQDVERCMPENLYFRQPKTQTMLLDILFIWSKLNQGVGYRQGMHEILAPIVWAVERDAIDPLSASQTTTSTNRKATLETFNAAWIEHDSFVIFEAVMRSLKSAFAATTMKSRSHKYSTSISSEPEIVPRSRRIVGQKLAAVDPQLASHLAELDIAPQLFLMRWIRLLFGREFAFDQCMDLWDFIFTEEATAECIDLVCVSMILQIRWQLIDADHNTALTTLLHYPSLPPSEHPTSFFEDARRLKSVLDADTGRAIIFRRTGKIPRTSGKPKALLSAHPNGGKRIEPSPHSPHLLPPPRPTHNPSNSFEAVLQNAARSVYSSGERLGVNKAVRDAVGDVRRNAYSISTNLRNRTHSRNTSFASNADDAPTNLQGQIDDLYLRNQSLAKMLEGAVNDLWQQQKEMAIDLSNRPSQASDERIKSLTMAIARVQLAQVYLEDPDLPLPEDEVHVSFEATEERGGKDEVGFARHEPTPEVAIQPPPDNLAQSPPQASPGVDETSFYFQETRRPQTSASKAVRVGLEDKSITGERNKATVTRPSLEESPFSWMLGQHPSNGPYSSGSGGPFESAELRGNGRKSRAHGNAGFLFGESEEDGTPLASQ